MIKIDLITGFLGSGKTTFIRMYAKYLLGQGMRIAILENDFGAINVDMMLLKDLESENCDLQMVIGGNDYDCHKRRLKSKLITLGMLGYDRVIMEPSGIFDVDEFLDTLQEDPLCRWYEIGTIVSIVDARLSDDLSEESDYLLVSQTADAGAIVLSKSQFSTEEDRKKTLAHVNRAFQKFRTNRQLTKDDLILEKDWKDYGDKEFSTILHAGYVLKDHIKLPVTNENNYETLFYMDVRLDPDQLQKQVEKLFQDPACGHIIRIKGFLKTEKGWLEVNATREEMKVTPASEGQEVIIVIGENLNRKRIESYWTFVYGSGHEQNRAE